MKLTEAIEIPLFENYKDLRSNLERMIENQSDLSISNAEDYMDRIADTLEKIEAKDSNVPDPYIVKQNAYLSKNPQKSAKILTNITRFIYQHPLMSSETVDEVFKEMRTAANISYVVRFIEFRLSKLFEEIEYRARFKEEPDMDKLLSGRQYTVYQLNNYTAARKICNTYNKNFCIGSSDPHYFDEFGPRRENDTIAIILSNNRVVMLHVADRDDWLLTSSDNNNSYNSSEHETGTGFEAIYEDFVSAGMDSDDIQGLLTEFINLTLTMENILSSGTDNDINSQDAFKFSNGRYGVYISEAGEHLVVKTYDRARITARIQLPDDEFDLRIPVEVNGQESMADRERLAQLFTFTMGMTASDINQLIRYVFNTYEELGDEEDPMYQSLVAMEIFLQDGMEMISRRNQQ